MISKQHLSDIAEQYLNGSDLFLVEVGVSANNAIRIEIDSDTSVAVQHCIDLSRHIEQMLNRDEEDFELEVSSAGITSPFKLLRQYQNNVGNEVEVLTQAGVKLQGTIKEATPEQFLLTITKKVKPEGSKRKIEVQEDIALAYEEVKYTKKQIKIK